MGSRDRRQSSGHTTVLARSTTQAFYQSDTLSLREHTLRCVEGPYAGTEYPLTKDLLVIGRGEWCDVPLPKDDQTSRMHCELQVTPAGILVQDLESSNGCFLDGLRILHAPFEVQHTLQLGLSHFQLVRDRAAHEITIHFHDHSGLLVGRGPKMRKIFTMLERIADAEVPVFLGGETGTGKSSVARAMHEQSHRKDGALVTVNCGALSPSLIESSLFGHEVGAFTGADKQHRGFFEQAHGGTLFLDEIAELPLELQPKLLDVLERKKIRRLGGVDEIDVDFRLVTASHRDLYEAINEGRFREDLYYRLAVVELYIPPLRERLSDIPLLCQFLLNKFSEQPPQLTDSAIRKLKDFHWPGNVRQLSNILQRTIVLSANDIIDAAQVTLPDGQQDRSQSFTSSSSSSNEPSPSAPEVLSELSLREQLNIQEQQILLRTLEVFGWDVTESASRLGLSRASLYNRLNKFGLKRPDKDQ